MMAIMPFQRLRLASSLPSLLWIIIGSLALGAGCGDDTGPSSAGSGGGSSSTGGGSSPQGPGAGGGSGGEESTSGAGGDATSSGTGAGGGAGGGAVDGRAMTFLHDENAVWRLAPGESTPEPFLEAADLFGDAASGTSIEGAALSPDGTELLLATRWDGESSQATILAVPLAGGPLRTVYQHEPDLHVDIWQPRWSDDGRWISYVARIPSPGSGQPTANGTGWAIPAAGGPTPTQMVSFDVPPPGEGNVGVRALELAPGATVDDALILSWNLTTSFGPGGVYVTRLAGEGFSPGTVLDETFAFPHFDHARRVVARRVDDDGVTRLYRAAEQFQLPDIVPGSDLVDHLGPDVSIHDFAMSRDGRRALLCAGGPGTGVGDGSALFVLDVDTGASTPIAVGAPACFERLAWSPDGERVAVMADDAGEGALIVARSDGSSWSRIFSGGALSDEDAPYWHAMFSADSATLLALDSRNGILVTSDLETEDQSWDGARIAVPQEYDLSDNGVTVAGEAFDR